MEVYSMNRILSGRLSSKVSFTTTLNLLPVRSILVLLIWAFLRLSATAQGAKEEIPFTTILKAADSSIGYSLDRVIYSEAAWQSFWNEAHSNLPAVPPLPIIDFTQKMVIVTAMGTQPSPKHEITITRLVQVRNMLRVEIEKTEPGRGCSPLGVLRRPIHIVETESRPFVTFRRSIARARCVE
jgi:hypothetical protein